MQFLVNNSQMEHMLQFVKNFLKSKKAKVKNYQIKEGRKEPIRPEIFYGNYIGELMPYIHVNDFVNYINYITNDSKNIIDIEDSDQYAEVILKCTCVLNKFKWLRSDEFDIIFYRKTHESAEEYRYLTTDITSNKFYTCLNQNERTELTMHISEFNEGKEGAAKIKDPIKFVSTIIRHMYMSFDYALSKEPITLSNDPNEPCFKFYDIEDLKKRGKLYQDKNKNELPNISAWEEFFERIEDRNMIPVVKAFFAGIFLQKNTSRQVLYMYGEGNDGKTEIINALLHELGAHVSFSLPQNMKFNHFTLYSAYGKRFFTGDEMKAENVFKTSVLHAMTGGSTVLVEKKNETPFSTKLFCVGIIASNLTPQLSNEENQLSRILMIRLKKASKEKRLKSGAQWKDDLKRQVRNLIYHGLQEFDAINPTGTMYDVPESQNEHLETLFDNKTKDIESFVSTMFQFDPESYVRSNLNRAFRAYCASEIFKDESVPPEYLDTKVTIDIFRALQHLAPDFKFAEKQITMEDGKRRRVVYGLSIKHHSPNSKLRSILSELNFTN